MDNIINGSLLDSGSGRSPMNLIVLFLLGGIAAILMPQIQLKKRLMLGAGGLVMTLGVQYYMIAFMATLPPDGLCRARAVAVHGRRPVP